LEKIRFSLCQKI